MLYRKLFLENYKNRVPSYFEIGAIYERLIKQISNSKEDYIDNLIKVLTSWIITKINNYDSSMYYENPSYLFECYKENKMLGKNRRKNNRSARMS